MMKRQEMFPGKQGLPGEVFLLAAAAAPAGEVLADLAEAAQVAEAAPAGGSIWPIAHFLVQILFNKVFMIKYI